MKRLTECPRCGGPLEFVSTPERFDYVYWTCLGDICIFSMQVPKIQQVGKLLANVQCPDLNICGTKLGLLVGMERLLEEGGFHRKNKQLKEVVNYFAQFGNEIETLVLSRNDEHYWIISPFHGSHTIELEWQKDEQFLIMPDYGYNEWSESQYIDLIYAHHFSVDCIQPYFYKGLYSYDRYCGWLSIEESSDILLAGDVYERCVSEDPTCCCVNGLYWYFDETWTHLCGPFVTLLDAQASLENYVQYLEYGDTDGDDHIDWDDMMQMKHSFCCMEENQIDEVLKCKKCGNHFVATPHDEHSTVTCYRCGHSAFVEY